MLTEILEPTVTANAWEPLVADPFKSISTGLRNTGKLTLSPVKLKGAGGWETVFVFPPDTNGELAMSSYQIHYLNCQKALACLMVAQCESDEDARSLASSLCGITHRTVEIWRGETLVYEGFNPHIAN